jgi:hypothetical protein
VYSCSLKDIINYCIIVTHNAGVGGSSPPVATIQIQRLMQTGPVPVFCWKCRVSAEERVEVNPGIGNEMLNPS